MNTRHAIALAALCTWFASGPVFAQSSAPTSYDAITDRGPRPKPALTGPAPLGAAFIDPAFGTTVRRITNNTTRPARPDRSYRTPSGTHQNAWSASGSLFYVVSTDGTVMPFAFDAATGRSSRIDPLPDGEGGFVLRFYMEPHFSYVTDGVIYGAMGGTTPGVDQYDFATRSYTRLLSLDAVAGGLAGTYVGGIMSSAGPVERLIAFFGGTSQDRHFYLVVFDKQDPSNRRLLDTKASTLDGAPTNIPLNFMLHAATIDRSGRYITLYPTGADRSAPRNAAPNYQWDTATDVFTELPSVAARSNGHDAYGYGARVNQDCCTTTTWDAAQWQLRALASPLQTRDIITPVLMPKEIYLADHPSWHNARPDRMVPFISGLYRYGANTTEWRAWDDEIVGVETGMAADAGGVVWRFAHHRSDTRHDLDPSRIGFWYTPRPNVSPDGRWVLFTSNWEKTLGTDPAGESGASARQDVFLLELRPAAVSEPPPPGNDPVDPPSEPLTITTTTLPDGRRNANYDAALLAANATGTTVWSVTSGMLPPGYLLDAASGTIAGKCRMRGSWTFTIAVVDEAGAASQSYTLQVR